jgi:glycosyltransferase involved in cell wall biosynthesis
MKQLDTIDSSALPLANRPSQPAALVTMPERFSAIVPLFNCKAELRACLDALLAAASRYGNAEVIVVDNGSTDGSYEILRAEYPGVTALRHPELSIAALRNRGVEAATGEYLCFVDADCVVHPDYFGAAQATFEACDAAATGSMCGVPKSSTWVERTWYELNSHSRNGLVKYINSGNLVIRGRVFTSVGGFDERLTTGEDTELGQRLRSHGFFIYENHQVSAVHLRNSKTLGEFFSRHAWHGQGLLIVSSASWLNKPLLMTCAHVLLIALGTAQLFVPYGSWAWRVGFLLLALSLVPAVTWLFRSVTNRRWSSPLAGIAIYQFYYAAKLYALFGFAKRRRSRTYHK